MAGGIVWTSDSLSPNLKAAPLKLRERLFTFMQYQESHVQDYMRNNASWTDRTSNARNGLFAKAVRNGSTMSIVCYHTMPYGIWLEVRFSGRYAIINPTIQAEGQRIMGQLGDVISRLAS